MSAFKNFRSTAIPLPIENVDTDQIIPARFLKATTREGFGKNLFCDWRYKDNGQANSEFVLNNPIYSGKILVAGHNFGCGSSREHAAWALKDYGIDVVVSSFFADIFKGNALNNGILPVQLSNDQLITILNYLEEDPTQIFSINLQEQTIKIVGTNHEFSFEIPAYKKMCLLNAYDDLSFLMSKIEEIKKFEKNHKIY